MAKARLDGVRRHFEDEASIFDARVVKIVPHYEDMLGTLVDAIPFPTGKRIDVIDLGCGTGTVAHLIRQRFPRAQITCVDMAANMLALAERKLRGASDVAFERGDLRTYQFNRKSDVVVSSLAFHHIESGRTKTAVFSRVFNALKRGGAFLNADIFISRNKRITRMYLEKWAEFILRSYSQRDLQRNYRRYKREDRPADLQGELSALKQAGFRYVDVLWKCYNFATYIAVK